MSRTSRRSARAIVCAAVSCTAAAGNARAQEPATDVDETRGLFFEARSLMDAQRWDEARVLLERGEQLRPGKGTEFNLAECYDHLGRPAAAWTLYERVAAMSKAASLSAHEDLARQRADAVDPRVPRLAVDVVEQADVDGLEIRVDGIRLSVDGYGRPSRVEPGHHHVVASAPMHVPLDVEIDLSEGERLTVRVPPLASIATDPPATLRPERPDDAIAKPDPGGGWRTAGFVAGGAGLAALAVGGVFVGLSLAARGNSSPWCNTSTGACTSRQGVDSLSRAVSDGNFATGFVAAGATLLAAGAVLWFASPRLPQPIGVGLSANPDGGIGITLRGGEL